MDSADLQVASGILEAIARVGRIPENVVRSIVETKLGTTRYETAMRSLIEHSMIEREGEVLVLKSRRGPHYAFEETEVTVRRSDRFGDTILVKVKHLPRLFHHRSVIHGDYKHPRIYNQDGWYLDDMYWYMVDEEGGLRLIRRGLPRVIDLKTMREMEVDNV